MSSFPTVSVIIPTYNRANFLPSAIKSVLDQTYPNVEIIVVDDGSTDDTRMVIERFEPDVRYLSSDHKGTAHARNVGMKAATGKYLAFLDSDDRYLPYKLEIEVEFIKSHSEVGMVCTEFSGDYNNGHIEEYHLRNYHSIWNRKGWRYEDIFSANGDYSPDVLGRPISYYTGDLFQYVLMEPIIASNTILFPRKILDTVGYQNESYRVLQEYEFVVRICKHFKVAFLNVPTYVLRYHDGQATKFAADSFFRKPEKMLLEIELWEIMLNTVMDWGYKDKIFYHENQEFINSRIIELNCQLGTKNMEYGDADKARKYFQYCRKYGKIQNKYQKYLLLSYLPTFINKRLTRLMYFVKVLIQAGWPDGSEKLSSTICNG